MPKALVVDDAAFMRMRLKGILEKEGYTVMEAENGQHALQVVSEERPNVIFLDITMPVMDGLETLRALNSRELGIPVIMCSAMGQKSMVLEAIKLGAVDFIVKPFQPERVKEALKRL